MAKPDLELEELDQRFAEVEKTIQSVCEIMEKLKEVSPKIEKIHKMSSEIHEIRDKTVQALKPVKVRLESLADSHNQAAERLEGLKLELRELQEAKELIWTELSKCASSKRQSEFEEKMEAKATGLERNASEQNDRLCTAVAKLSDILENQDDRIKSIAQESSRNAKNVKIALLLGTAALFLAAAVLFLGR